MPRHQTTFRDPQRQPQRPQQPVWQKRPQQQPQPQPQPLLIQTKSGLVNGTNFNSDVKAWLGIPYAEPPLGNLILLNIQ